MKHLSRRQAVSSLLLIAAPVLTVAAPAAAIPDVALVQPAQLAERLRNSSAPGRLILQVGFKVLYDRAHIPGAEYAGPGRDPEGLKLLRERVASLPRDTELVVYCGCCPWSHCPNIAAAYETLSSLGLSRVKVLYIADNFGTDWIDKGYPVTLAH
jgi:hypothetical protein